jgi:hypothetical protein
VSPPSAGTHAAAQTVTPLQQLQATIRLQSDLDALTAQTTATEGDLLNAVATLQQHSQAVAGSHASSDDADWQQALNTLQQALAAVQQLANANSSTPDAPNPLHQGPSTTSTSSPAPAAPPTPAPTTTPAPTNPVVDLINNAFGQLQKVANALSFTVIVDNKGTGTVTDGNGKSNPAINCGPAKNNCQGKVLVPDQVQLIFQPLERRTVSNIVSVPNGACNPAYETGKTKASCMIGATAGATITVTVQWG